jgi:hypothetical protein
MNTLTDGTGRWFDPDQSEHLGRIDRDEVRGSEEEYLWFTADGLYVLEKIKHEDSQEYRDCQEVSPSEAAIWLADNSLPIPEHLHRHLRQR